jgi:uncharacterized phage-like protein YoqJ
MRFILSLLGTINKCNLDKYGFKRCSPLLIRNTSPRVLQISKANMIFYKSKKDAKNKSLSKKKNTKSDYNNHSEYDIDLAANYRG